MQKKVAFYTLGCRVNQYETAAMEALFCKAGYEVVPFQAAADVYVINTCTVTAESERKCRQILRRAKGKNPASVVAAVGCMAQSSFSVLEAMPEVDVIVGVAEKSRIVERVSMLQKPAARPMISAATTFEELSVTNFSSRDRAFVKIQDGCDRYCSYCIIPYVRGPVRSRDPENVLEEIQKLCDNGFREVVLTGIHVASYGRGTDTSLGDLIRRVAAIPRIERIRLSSVDPVAFTEDFLAAVRETPKLCPHFHISLQSGCDHVLRRMNRRYTTKQYASVLKSLRKINPSVAITTDIITGFPGETEADFAETIAFCKAVQLSGIHVFPYSERQGTAAAKMDGVVPKKVREDRAKQLIAVAAALRHAYASSFIGTQQTVLPEHGKVASGFTPHFLRVALPKAAAKDGRLVNVLIESCEGDILYGKCMQEHS